MNTPRPRQSTTSLLKEYLEKSQGKRFYRLDGSRSHENTQEDMSNSVWTCELCNQRGEGDAVDGKYRKF